MNDLPKSASFKRFHIAFWLMAGFALFVSGYSQSNFVVSFIRNFYLMSSGGVLTYFLLIRWPRLPNEKIQKSWILFLCSTYLIGTLLIVTINPVTYSQVGLALEEITWRHVFAGSMNYSMVLVFWGVCLIFLFETGFRLPFQGGTAPTGLSRVSIFAAPKGLEVDQGRRTAHIPLKDICYLKGAGDYVEIHLLNKGTYLKKATIKSLLDLLGPSGFVQVHRSLVLNQNAIVGYEGHSKGSFTLVMRNEDRLKTSRRFQSHVRDILEGNRALSSEGT